MTINEAFEILLEIALDSGENSQERKIEKTANLLRGLDPLSAKYAIRIILGNLRLGFSDRTVLDALSKLVAGDKSARKNWRKFTMYGLILGGWQNKFKTRNSEFATLQLVLNWGLHSPVIMPTAGRDGGNC